MAVIGVIGNGVVGRATAEGLRYTNTILVQDKDEGDGLERIADECVCIFLCLPTPCDYEKMRIDMECMDSVVEEIAEIGTDAVVTIRSTVLPGTARAYAEKYPGLWFASNPEFLTEADPLSDFILAPRVVIGSDDRNGIVVERIYRERFPDKKIFTTDTVSAEMVKYQSNILLASKVALANVFYDACEAIGADYNTVREAVAADPRIGASHLGVTPERGFGGKCFPKDLGAMIGWCFDHGIDGGLLEETFAYNTRIRVRSENKRVTPGRKK